jgi:hypothetical protein
MKILFSSLAVKDNLKEAYLEKKSNNPDIYLLTVLVNCFMLYGGIKPFLLYAAYVLKKYGRDTKSDRFLAKNIFQ